MLEKDKMKLGHWYDPNFDSDLVSQRDQAQDLCYDFNQLRPSQRAERQALLEQIFDQDMTGIEILSPLTVDYGKNTSFGPRTHVNVNSYFMDGAPIKIGVNCFIGPHCGFYTAHHAMGIDHRNQGLEKPGPIEVGDNCWFGANVSVMPGVTIGPGCVVAAGAVVTKDMPANSLIAGVPGRIIREINQEEEAEKITAELDQEAEERGENLSSK